MKNTLYDANGVELHTETKYTVIYRVDGCRQDVVFDSAKEAWRYVFYLNPQTAVDAEAKTQQPTRP